MGKMVTMVMVWRGLPRGVLCLTTFPPTALMDGAGYLKRLTRIVVPLSKPILATIILFSIVGQWNAYMDTVLYTSGTRLQTLQSILYQYLNSARQLADMMKKGGRVSGEMVMQMTNLQSARQVFTRIIL